MHALRKTNLKYFTGNLIGDEASGGERRSGGGGKVGNATDLECETYKLKINTNTTLINLWLGFT